jgi:hypothetical protein
MKRRRIQKICIVLVYGKAREATKLPRKKLQPYICRRIGVELDEKGVDIEYP